MTSLAKDNVVQRLGLASYEMSININMAQKAFRSLLKTCLGHHGLTIPQWTFLGQLYTKGTIRPNSAATILGISPPYIARLISQLERQELITAVMFPDDARGKEVALTAKGRQLVENVEVKLEECLNQQLGSIKSDDLQTYFMLTKFIAQNVRHH